MTTAQTKNVHPEHAAVIREAILKAGEQGRFFTVKFVKRTDGQIRTMNARLGVTKHLQGGTQGYDPKAHNLITVWDAQAKDYRSINLETVFALESKHFWEPEE